MQICQKSSKMRSSHNGQWVELINIATFVFLRHPVTILSNTLNCSLESAFPWENTPLLLRPFMNYGMQVKLFFDALPPVCFVLLPYTLSSEIKKATSPLFCMTSFIYCPSFNLLWRKLIFWSSDFSSFLAWSTLNKITTRANQD